MTKLLTIDENSWNQFLQKIDSIYDYIQELENNESHLDNLWLHNNDVCEYLHISKRTLSRMRQANEITYSKIHGQYFYTFGNIRKMLEARTVKSTQDYLEKLTQKAEKYVEKGRNFR